MRAFLLITLVLANIGYFVWARGEAGSASANGEREPQRMTQQLRPQLLQIRRPDSAAVPTPAAPPAPARPPASEGTPADEPGGAAR